MLLATLGISVVLGVPERADAADRAQPRGMTAGAAWRPCGTAPTVRGTCAAGLVATGGVHRKHRTRGLRGADHLAGSHPPPGEPAAAPDRIPVRELRRPGPARRRHDRGARRGVRQARAGPVRHRQLGSARNQYERAGELLRQRCQPAALLVPNWSVPTTPAESRRYVPKTIEFARLCAAHAGRLLRHASTTDTVRDLDYLRWLVGDRRLNYYGQSYGTFVGQVYANMFPGRVRLMALDAVIDPIPYTRSVQAAIAANESTPTCSSRSSSRCARRRARQGVHSPATDRSPRG